jgi:hypothetical protein
MKLYVHEFGFCSVKIANMFTVLCTVSCRVAYLKFKKYAVPRGNLSQRIIKGDVVITDLNKATLLKRVEGNVIYNH